MYKASLCFVSVAFSLAFAAAAQAQPLAAGRAALSDFTITLTDLNTADSLSPTLDVIPGTVSTGYSAGSDYRVLPTFFPVADMSATDGVSIATLNVTPNSMIATTWDQDESQGNWAAAASTQANFSLSAHAKVAVSGTLSASTTCTDCGFATSWALVSVIQGDIGGMRKSFELLSNEGELLSDLPFNISVVNDSDQSMSVWLTTVVAVSPFIPPPPVSEPSTLLLTLSGLCLLARRRTLRLGSVRWVFAWSAAALSLPFTALRIWTWPTQPTTGPTDNMRCAYARRGVAHGSKYLTMHHHPPAIALLSIVVMSGASSAANSQQTYAIRDLGSLSANGSSYGSGINVMGGATGWAELSPGYTHAFATDPGGRMLDLGTLLPDGYSEGKAINSAGAVTGSATVRADGLRHAFVKAPGKSMIDIGTLPGGSGIEGLAINSSGKVAGRSDTANSFHAFVTESSGMLIDLGTLGGSRSEARGINDRGQVTGWAETADGTAHAFIAVEGGAMRDLGSDGHSSFGNAINSSGQVTGHFDVADAGHAFVTDLQGRMVDLGALPLGGHDSVRVWRSTAWAMWWVGRCRH